MDDCGSPVLRALLEAMPDAVRDTKLPYMP